ncbi:23S rRNA (adenine(2503)-C(2))-methyltransferase RlmN [Nocardia sp. BMG51109]|uniref:23S rRNA (adenine(2503)-C(2))-methyltransferase RlmN n=1 Tax=Nocardia sp. BMG51109 TaxID=1056816 RepID=UPI000467D71D|nr:23S rRNA (adenine(2503)-C(2))-methyltransferase RlmN [Nocardia sp. BMG51109]
MVELAKKSRSEDGSVRFVWRLEGGHEVESVLFRTTPTSFIQPAAQCGERRLDLPSGAVVCISSQAGCNVGCRFCATGLQPMRKNLSAEEISAQVFAAAREEGISGGIRVVFAGMGEPMLNYEPVRDAALRLAGHDDIRNVAISTMGIVPAIRRLAAEAPTVDLYVSLHAATDPLRTTLVPLNRKYPIEAVLAAATEFATSTGRRVDISYLLLRGINDSAGDARELAALLDPDLFTVKVLLWNEVAGLPFERVPDEHAVLFADWLADQGQPAYVIPSKARDVDAGCGQMITTEPSATRLRRVTSEFPRIDLGPVSVREGTR